MKVNSRGQAALREAPGQRPNNKETVIIYYDPSSKTFGGGPSSESNTWI